MDSQPNQSDYEHSNTVEALLRDALLLDLEVGSKREILKLGAKLGDAAFATAGAFNLQQAISTLSTMAGSASCILGHNIVSHDLAILEETFPSHAALSLPVIDTLVLSPICFPENPYHRLVKDYKLVSESANDPLADALQAAKLFADEFRALDGLRQTEPQLFELLHFLLGMPDENTQSLARGMEIVFSALGSIMPSRSRALKLCRELFARWGCSSKLVDDTFVQSSTKRMAAAYALSWLRIAGANSILPPWVRLQHPEASKLVQWLRETPCTATTCGYCRSAFDPRAQLRKFFNFDDFRSKPSNSQGGSLQRDIVEAGLHNQSLLAILPTGGGKSLCFQVPALARNVRRGVLTIVISPLQALMKDQVDGLIRRTGSPFAAALYGLLTQLERGDVLARVRMGDIAILYVSPEQLRNRSFRNAIAQREIGCWVFDEAHCLSKWGHDFRPDYLYAGRFIREFSHAQGVEIPAIACFTATAKREVKEEITNYFKAETGRDLAVFEGGVERNNLQFEVQAITSHAKLERIHDLLSERLGRNQPGSAIIFRATREATEETSRFLQSKNWPAARFHAGLTPPEKKRIQDEFLAGEVKVICATNAFGMGIDKEDVRLVVHGDTPGSLENYLQEAGRAGRDGKSAECVLLFQEDDCEQQFRLGRFSELSRRDIAQILRTLRKTAGGTRDEIVVTAGEILRDEEMDVDFDAEERSAETKVRTAISWLERAGFLQRDENVTSVFQARLQVRTLQEAQAKMAPLKLSDQEHSLWLAIVRELMNAGVSESLTVDHLASLREFTSYAATNPKTGLKLTPEQVSGKILRILGNMSQVGIMKRDMLMSAYVRHKVSDHSRIRLDRILLLDRKMIDLLSTEEPDPEGWMILSLRQLNQRLLDQQIPSSPELLRGLLKSLSEDGKGFAGTHGSIELRHYCRDSYKVRVRRSWSAISDLAEKRRRVASLVVELLLGKIPTETPASAELLLQFSFEELHDAVDRDMYLHSEIKDIDAALERALMYLHEQRVIILQQGLAVFRSAMTIRLPREAKGERYKASDYQPLEHHYGERVLQVHVMSEYAQRGLERIAEAVRLVVAYFSLDKEAFIRQYLRTKLELLKLATTAQSFQKIVSNLNCPAQIKIVTAPASRNMLILAGPGSGKTKTVVHRCAYLLRVERVRPQSVLICCFNRNAALELRRRLTDLVGEEARGVTILTYHGLAMRLLGRSFADRTPGVEINFDDLIAEAVKLLRGEHVLPGVEGDEVRERLLAGFQFILVDEYQDIDQPQYEMISAIAGRTLDDPDLKLSILAVGDDDQNIYSFRGTNVEFIRRFQKDYDAEIHYLIENYRSSRYIIEASNAVICANADRMKVEHPIRIDGRRGLLPAGGEFGRRDDLTGGKVQLLRVRDSAEQANAVIEEIQRLKALGVTDLTSVAVLSSNHRDLGQVRALAEMEGIAVRWCAGQHAMPSLSSIREIRAFLVHLAQHRASLVRASDICDKTATLLQAAPDNPWVRFLSHMTRAWQTESSNAELPVQEVLDSFYEACAESRRDFGYGEGVTLSTVHSAKGTEYDHVLLIGAWPVESIRAATEEKRRAFYVGMTRARQSLTVFDRLDIRPSLPDSLAGPAFLCRDFKGSLRAQGPEVTYVSLGLDDLNLGYAGLFPESHPIHAALGRLKPGAILAMQREQPAGIGLYDAQGTRVARLARKSENEWSNNLQRVRTIRVVAMVQRFAEQDPDLTRRGRYQVSSWEVPVIEVIVTASVRAL